MLIVGWIFKKYKWPLSIFYFSCLFKVRIAFLVLIFSMSLLVFSFKNFRFSLIRSYAVLDKGKCAPIGNRSNSRGSKLTTKSLRIFGWCGCLSFPRGCWWGYWLNLTVCLAAAVCLEDDGMLSGTICGSCCCRYLMSNSSSLLAFRFHTASAVSAGFVMTFWSKQAIFVTSHHKFDDLGDVAILLKCVFVFYQNALRMVLI